MVNRSNLGVRSRKKSLERLSRDKAENPEKYQHETSDKSKFLAMDYDYKNGVLPPHKLETYKKLKAVFVE